MGIVQELITCPCSGHILADTEEWKVPRCFDCATPDGTTDTWRCKRCTLRPYACECAEPEWTQGMIECKS